MAFTTFKWEISNETYLSFVNAKHQQEFTSSLFEVDNIKFCLKCYPNGRKKSGLVNLYLALSPHHFPSNIAKLKINYWLFCHQTHCRMSDIRDFSPNDNNTFHGWATNTLSLKTLENNSSHSITFQVGVNVLKMYFKSDVSKGSDIIHKRLQPLIYEKPFKMKSKVTYKWNISPFMFKSFLSAPNKKCWESEQFDQWVIGCYPNGHSKTDAGNAMLYLKILGLPPSIYGVKIRYTLYCPQINLKWSYVQNYNYANTNYANATFETATLHSLKSLSFEITITILKLIDLKHKEVEFKDSKKYLQFETTKAKKESPNESVSEVALFDLYGTMESIKQKLIGASKKDESGQSKDEISAVQEQVNIYSKELQSMNRSIHFTQKGFECLESKIFKSNEAMQIVLKQVKAIKNEVDALKNNQNEHNEEKIKDDEDDNKVNNADADEISEYHQDKMLTLIESQNELIEAMKKEMEQNKKILMSEIADLRDALDKEKKSNEDINYIKQQMTQCEKGYNEKFTNVECKMEQINSKFVEYKLQKDANEENESMKKQIFSLKHMLSELSEELTRQQQQNRDILKEENKESDEDQKEKHLKIREWVLTNLEFGKNDLESIYNKLINDGFDEISLLSELNDDTLKSMGIHKRGDRIKILRACKAIND